MDEEADAPTTTATMTGPNCGVECRLFACNIIDSQNIRNGREVELKLSKNLFIHSECFALHVQKGESKPEPNQVN